MSCCCIAPCRLYFIHLLFSENHDHLYFKYNQKRSDSLELDHLALRRGTQEGSGTACVIDFDDGRQPFSFCLLPTQSACTASEEFVSSSYICCTPFSAPPSWLSWPVSGSEQQYPYNMSPCEVTFLWKTGLVCPPYPLCLRSYRRLPAIRYSRNTSLVLRNSFQNPKWVKITDTAQYHDCYSVHVDAC